MSVGSASRSDSDLTPDERRLLANTHAELRAAVKNYEQYLGGELKSSTPIPVVGASELREAQERIDEAEENLWSPGASSGMVSASVDAESFSRHRLVFGRRR